MPCRDGIEDDPQVVASRYSKQVKLHEAIICGLLRLLDKEFGYDTKAVLLDFDYEQQGVTQKELETVIREHRLKDEAKRREEEEKIRKEMLRQKALKKLTKEERKALGL